MESRLLLIGDLHFRPKDKEIDIIMVKEILDIIEENRPDAVVILGDTLDTHNIINSGSLTLAVDFFKRISTITKLIVLIGNHDIKNNQIDLSTSSEDHPFTALELWENTVLVDKVKEFYIKDHKFCGVPYLPPGKYMNAIKDIDDNTVSAYFSHQEFNGAFYKPGDSPITDADEWPDDKKVNFCGHFHEYNRVKNNLIYVGTPTTTDFGATDDKALMLVTFKEDYSFSYDRIRLKTVPMRISYKVEARSSELTQVLNSIKSRDSPGIYKVVIYGKSQALSTIKKTIQYRELNKLAKITEESIGTDLVLCKGVSNEVILNGNYEQILKELLKQHPDELDMYVRLFKS